MKVKIVSDAVVKRLPRYRRYLNDLKAKGTARISSGELANKMDLTASQIRQDLNNFGGFGQQGFGYSVDGLHEAISNIIGLDRTYSVVMIGCGRLGEAIANFLKNYEPAFDIKAICDIRPDYQGKEVCGVKIMNDNEFVEYITKNHADIAILSIPPEQVDDVKTLLVQNGIKGIWNFSLTEIEHIRGVAVQNMHLSDSLHSLVYYINHPE